MSEDTNSLVKHPAEIARLEAEAAKLRAEELNHIALARYNQALGLHWEAKAAESALELVQKQRVEDSILAQDYFHRVYQFNTRFDATSCQRAISQLSEWHRLEVHLDPAERSPIQIIINSPGGSAVEGLALFDYIQVLRRQGHVVTTTALGMAASMGGILLQAGDKRTMGREAYLLIHEVAFGAGGKIGDVEDTVEFGRKMANRILNIFAHRSKLTAAQIKKRWDRKDWWLTSNEALEFGFVDEVI